MKYKIVAGMVASLLAVSGIVEASDTRRDLRSNSRVRSLVVQVQNNSTAIEQNGTGITENASNITANTNGVAANADNISINASGVEGNASGVAANANGISTNASGVATNAAAIAGLAVEQSFDYRDFSADPTITSKVFAISGGGLAATGCVTETRSATRNIDSTTILERVRTDVNGLNCGFNVFTFDGRADGLFLLSNDARTPDGFASRNLREVDEGLLARTTSMQVGRSFGNGSGLTITRNSGVSTSAVVQNGTLQGISDVTVPLNGGTTFSSCLRIHTNRDSANGLGGDFNFVSWYCADVGLVKRIDSIGNVLNLTEVISAP